MSDMFDESFIDGLPSDPLDAVVAIITEYRAHARDKTLLHEKSIIAAEAFYCGGSICGGRRIFGGFRPSAAQSPRQ